MNVVVGQAVTFIRLVDDIRVRDPLTAEYGIIAGLLIILKQSAYDLSGDHVVRVIRDNSQSKHAVRSQVVHNKRLNRPHLQHGRALVHLYNNNNTSKHHHRNILKQIASVV